MSKIRVQKTSQFIFSEAFEEFIREKERKNCSPETIRFYRENINRFLEFSQGEISGNVSKSMVDSYYSYLKTLHISIESIATYMRALRAVLYDFMALLFSSDTRNTSLYRKEDLTMFLYYMLICAAVYFILEKFTDKK